jgi:hypothetical protein
MDRVSRGHTGRRRASTKSLRELKPGETSWVERGIYAYRTDKGIRYGISFMDGDKRRMKIVGDKLTDARSELEAKRTDVRRGDYKHVDRRAMPTFEEYAKAYVEHGRKIGKRSVDRDELALRAACVVFEVLESTWCFNRINTDTAGLRDHFKQFVDGDDGILVSKCSSWASFNVNGTPKQLTS